MIWTATVLACLLAAEDAFSTGDAPRLIKPRLVMAPNAVSILQRDNLIVRVTLINPPGEMKVDVPKGQSYGTYFKIQIRRSDDWEQVRTMEEAWGEGLDSGGPRTIPAKSEFAEYSVYQVQDEKFIFDHPGRVEIRAVTQSTYGELKSNIVVINVGKRSQTDLARIASPTTGPHYTTLKSLKWKLSPEGTALQEVGGNIKTTIGNFLLVQDFLVSGKIDGADVSKANMCDVLKRRLDSVSNEVALQLLGRYYAERQDADSLATVIKAMPYQSGPRSHLDGQLERLQSRVGNDRR